MTPVWDDADRIPIPEPPAPDEHLASAVARLEQAGTTRFSTRSLGGYDRTEVDGFLAELATSISDVRTALDRDRRELAALRAENVKLKASANSDLEQEVTLGAVGLLSQAQVIADKAVADAEQYARDLVITARNQYREVLERGAERAAQAGAKAEVPTSTAPIPTLPPMPEIEYVRTYAQVAQIQLRSVLDALTEQVDRLGSLPQSVQEAPAAPAPVVDEDAVPDEEPDWLPAVPPLPTIQRQTYISP
ncbi:DivIVA domain-containing protein [Agromyces sp. MMS24-JH15]|uniref:DivIVA domain-containing protein n=1 Tax=Agromyces sp. MMS24-JH15 TaxID=3243765 RepID=UPI00374A3754